MHPVSQSYQHPVQDPLILFLQICNYIWSETSLFYRYFCLPVYRRYASFDELWSCSRLTSSQNNKEKILRYFKWELYLPFAILGSLFIRLSTVRLEGFSLSLSAERNIIFLGPIVVRHILAYLLAFWAGVEDNNLGSPWTAHPSPYILIRAIAVVVAPVASPDMHHKDKPCREPSHFKALPKSLWSCLLEFSSGRQSPRCFCQFWLLLLYVFYAAYPREGIVPSDIIYLWYHKYSYILLRYKCSGSDLTAWQANHLNIFYYFYVTPLFSIISMCPRYFLLFLFHLRFFTHSSSASCYWFWLLQPKWQVKRPLSC